MQRTTVSAKETFVIIGLVLLVDIVILILWTVLDPLQWQRTVVASDQYMQPLESQGHCISDNWEVFAITIAVFHLVLMISASYMCYVSR